MKGIDIKEIAEFINGNIIGDDCLINNVSKIEEAKKGDITFISNSKYLKYLKTTEASAVVIDDTINIDEIFSPTIITVSNSYFAICMIMDRYFGKINHPKGISNNSELSESVKIGKNCAIGSFTFISSHVVIGNNVVIYPNCFLGENVIIKDNSIVYSNVSLYRDTLVGERCILHSGVVLGSDGFGHAPLPDGSYAKIPQIGNVVIGNDVEIGANTVIDRATMGNTVIEDGVKLDNLIQIAHNAKVGKNTVIAAQTGLSGSTVLGERCVIGGQVGFVGHIKVANRTQIGAQSGIMKEIKLEGQAFLGSPIRRLKDEIKSQVLIRKLPEIYSDLQELKKRSKKE